MRCQHFALKSRFVWLPHGVEMVWLDCVVRALLGFFVLGCTMAQVAIAYCKANAPLDKDLTSDDVGATAAFLASDMAGAVTGVTLYVDNGMHAMGMVQATSVDAVR